MTNGSGAASDAYDERNDYSWTEIAFEQLEAGVLSGEIKARSDVAWSRVWGPCPRCKHPIDDEQTLTAITGLSRPGTRGTKGLLPSRMDVDITCGCGERHAGAPEGVYGCGVSFRVDLPVQDADSGTP
jgi:hypothetical protein